MLDIQYSYAIAYINLWLWFSFCLTAHTTTFGITFKLYFGTFVLRCEKIWFCTIAYSQQARGWNDKNHSKTHIHTQREPGHKRMIEKSKIMRKIFSHRSRHTVVSRLPYHTLYLVCFFPLNISIKDFELVRIYCNAKSK